MSLQFFKSKKERPDPLCSILSLKIVNISDYNILCKIGEGSFSEVLKVQSIKTGQVFAAKRLKKMFKE